MFDWGGVELSPGDLPSLLKPDGKGIELIRRCQEEVYRDELERLRRGRSLRLCSSLLLLSPILGEDGLLRLGGRTGRAPLPYDNLHPPVLSGRHTLARKLAEAFHQSLKHIGVDFVLTHLR